MKKKRFLAMLMAAVISVTSIVPTFAADQIFTESGTASVTTNMEISSSYKVKLPASVSLQKNTVDPDARNEYISGYVVGAAGNIASDQFVNIIPDTTDLTMKDSAGKRSVEPTHYANKIAWSAEDLEAVEEGAFVDAGNLLKVSVTKAGRYSGHINYSFYLSNAKAENSYTFPTEGRETRVDNKGEVYYGEPVENTENNGENENTGYTLDLNLGEGKLDSEIPSVTPGQKYGPLPVPMREGYKFIGWFTEKEGGEQITEDSIVVKEQTLYAHWEKIIDNTDIYTLTWDKPLSEIGDYIGNDALVEGNEFNMGNKRIAYINPAGELSYANPYVANSIKIKKGSDVTLQMIPNGTNTGRNSRISWVNDGQRVDEKLLQTKSYQLFESKISPQASGRLIKMDDFKGPERYEWEIELLSREKAENTKIVFAVNKSSSMPSNFYIKYTDCSGSEVTTSPLRSESNIGNNATFRDYVESLENCTYEGKINDYNLYSISPSPGTQVTMFSDMSSPSWLIYIPIRGQYGTYYDMRGFLSDTLALRFTSNSLSGDLYASAKKSVSFIVPEDYEGSEIGVEDKKYGVEYAACIGPVHTQTSNTAIYIKSGHNLPDSVASEVDQGLYINGLKGITLF